MATQGPDGDSVRTPLLLELLRICTGGVKTERGIQSTSQRTRPQYVDEGKFPHLTVRMRSCLGGNTLPQPHVRRAHHAAQRGGNIHSVVQQSGDMTSIQIRSIICQHLLDFLPSYY